MLLFLVTVIFFILYIKSLSRICDTRSLPFCFWKGLSFSLSSVSVARTNRSGILQFLPRPYPMGHASISDESQGQGGDVQSSLLDLPDLALECILEKLRPSELRSMAGICGSLRERCTSDYFWDRHLKQKWGRIMGPASYRKWQWFLASRRSSNDSEGFGPQGLMKFIWRQVWPFSRCKSETKSVEAGRMPVDSLMSWYLALETGKFWFPAQVYNRENCHVGFMLSCYDAEICYDSRTDTFQARYPPHGRRPASIENGIQWERLRAAPMDTSPHDLHISDCLDDLHPGDHIEIQWRRNKEFPYGWWYGVVGHLETCNGNDNYCQCHSSDIVMLEFNQYTIGSRWRCAAISRKEHTETGNEGDGFYGGVRKLFSDHDINTWKRLWPLDILE